MKGKLRSPWFGLLLLSVFMLLLALPAVAQDEALPDLATIRASELSIFDEAALGEDQVLGCSDDGSCTIVGMLVVPPDDEDGDILITDATGNSFIVAPAGAFRPSRVKNLDAEVVLTGTLTGVGVDLDNDAVEGENFFCANRNMQHPAAGRLATDFEIDYGVVIGAFCGEEAGARGLGIGEIRRALRLAELADADLAEILEMRADGLGWGPLIREYGFHPSDLAPGRNNRGDPPPGVGRGQGRGRGNGLGNRP